MKTILSRCLALLACGLSLEEIHHPATAASGDLDLTFGHGGKVTTMAGSHREPGNGVAVQADGKIVVAGVFGTPSDYDFGVVRFNADGSPDISFGYKGKVTTHIGSTAEYCLSVAVQEDGKIVAAGYSHNGSNYDFALVRYNADGTLDTGFGNGGKVTTGIGSNDYGQSVAVQEGGKIVVAGYSFNGNNNDFALVRYTANGTLDASFGTGGKVTTGIGDFNDYGHQVIVQGDGKLLVTGYCNGATTDDFALARYNAGGTLDTSFGNGGKVMTDVGQGHDYGRSVAVQNDGKIVVAGYAQLVSIQDFALVRYHPDGSLDSSFGNAGKVTTDIGSGTTDYGYSVALQANGQIVVAGRSLNANKNFDFAVARYNANGTLDAGFGNGGKTTTAVGSGPNYGYGVALQSNGKIVVAGYSYDDRSGGYNFAVVRYESTSVAPAATTGQVLWTTTTSAHLSGMVNPNASETTVFFEVAKVGEPYGTLDNVAAHQSPLNGVTIQSVSGTKTGLLPHTAYKFRVKAISRAGTSVGEDVIFNTDNTQPVVQEKTIHPLGLGNTQTIFSPVTDASDADKDSLTVNVLSYSGTGIVQVIDGVVTYLGGPLNGAETVTVEVSDGFGGKDQATITLSNAAPVVTGETVNASYGRGVTISVLVNDSDADGDSLSVPSFTQPAHGEVVRAEKNPNALIYVPQLGFSGVDTFTYTVSDGRAASVGGTVEITVGPQLMPATTVAFNRGEVVPKAGDIKSGIPIGAIWNSFGVPAINDVGQVAILGHWRSPAGSGSGIFVNDQFVVKTGDPVPGASSLSFKSFTDPVINEAGRVAFLATITGLGEKKGDDVVLVTNAFSGALSVVAREGGTAPEAGNATFRKFYNISLRGGTGLTAGLLFTASLAGGSGQSKVTPANDLGAWLYSPSLDAWPRKVVREGDPGFAEGERIKSFQLLQAVKNSPGHGRGHYTDKAVSFVVSLSSKRQALVRFSAGILEAEELTGEFVGEALPEAKWKNFGQQATNRQGALAVRATLQNGLGGVTKANANGIFLSPGRGQAFEPVARLGDQAFGIPGASFSALSDPLISGPNSGMAFLGRVKGQGVRANNNTGIWWADQSGWSLVARTGAQAAEGPDGAFWKSFDSLALPDGERGPIFEATLAKGGGSVNASNDTGLWAVDSLGEVRLLVREQGLVGGKMLKSFSALQAVSGSAGVSRSFNNKGQLVYRAYFTDGSQGVIKVQVP